LAFNSQQTRASADFPTVTISAHPSADFPESGGEATATPRQR
jgi:hypothetical protein